MKINKLSAFILAGALTCTTPAMVYADTTSDAVDQAVSVLENSGVDDLLSDPDKVVDIIVAAKDAIGQIDVSESAMPLMWQQADLVFHLLILRNLHWFSYTTNSKI